jgi:uncharacterized repeat protein (TIGR04138 family)
MNADTAFWDAVDALRAQRRRYAREAYGFVVAALGATVQALPPARRDDPATRHLSGGELLLGVVNLARAEFGPLAPMVFREWGVVAGEDVGEIVFELVNCGQLSARPEDTLADFRGGVDLMALLAAAPSGGPASGRPADGPPGPTA